jgi:hypothetical protein
VPAVATVAELDRVVPPTAADASVTWIVTVADAPLTSPEAVE